MLVINNLLPKDLKNINTEMDFFSTLSNIFDKNPKVAEFMKELDGKSSTTYSHSVNVAFHVYEMISQNKDFDYTSDEIERWTEAALVHDAGKLQTDNKVLHSNSRLNGEQLVEMMEHSLKGLNKGLNFKFGKESIAAIIGHHVTAKALEAGPEREFVGASLSKDTWIPEFGEGYVESLLMEYCSWMEERDVAALETISFFDCVEALRSADRSYKPQIDWTTESLKDVENFIQSDIVSGSLSSRFNGLVLDKQFQAHFDDLQKLEAHKELKDLIAEYTKDVKVKVYEDKAKEIQENPELGQLFFEEKKDRNGNTWLVFEHESLASPVVMKKEKTVDIVRPATFMEIEDIALD